MTGAGFEGSAHPYKENILQIRAQESMPWMLEAKNAIHQHTQQQTAPTSGQ